MGARKGTETCCRLCAKRPWCEKNPSKGRQCCNAERQSPNCIQLIQSRWCSICNLFVGASLKQDDGQTKMFRESEPAEEPPTVPPPPSVTPSPPSPPSADEKLTPADILYKLIPVDCSARETRVKLVEDMRAKAKELGVVLSIEEKKGLLGLFVGKPKKKREFICSIAPIDLPAEKPKKEKKK